MLTNQIPFATFRIASKSSGATPDPRNPAKEGGFVFLGFKPVESRRREASGWSPFEPLATLRAFLFARRGKIKRRCFMDLNQIQDKIEEDLCKISFIEDFFSQPLVNSETPSFSEQGLTGLSFFFQNIVQDLRMILKELSQRYEEEVKS